MPQQVTLDDAGSVDDLLRLLAGMLREGERLPETCLLAVSGVHLGTVARHRPRDLQEGDEVVLITPVAGG
ncbi:MAG: MoaD/ThiS family protein [Pirellulales bacterium]|nr:MoaD/ThiS family protein [Pirellulales bacterium]